MQKSAVIEYKDDGYLEGFAVWDDAGTKRPGIPVFSYRLLSAAPV
jgi:hypothetical protein